jgi:hypothetical protein
MDLILYAGCIWLLIIFAEIIHGINKRNKWGQHLVAASCTAALALRHYLLAALRLTALR